MLTVIPKSKIAKISIYINTKRQSMSQIKKALGCQYILNAGLFNMATFKPINHLTVDEKVLSTTANPYGYGIKGTDLIFSYGNNVNAPTFLGAYPVLVRNGAALNEKAPAGLDGYRHRSAIGVTKTGDIVLLCEGVNRSLGGISGDLIKAGCDTAINLDGGASSQCDFDGKTITSSRVVHNYICIWTQNVSAITAPTDDAVAAQEWVKSMGISDGSSPDQPVSRKQVWQMLYRMNNKL